MKKLMAIATLGLGLGFPSLSFASDYMDLYTKPVVKTEVKDEIKGGNVEKDFISFYTSAKPVNTPASLTGGQISDDDKDYIIVFGVKVPVKVS
jgi:hypothetical protein